MRKHRIAVALVAAALGGFSIAGAEATAPTADQQQAAPAKQEECTPMRSLYSPKNWRDAKPLRGENPCPNARKKKLKAYFFLYRHYRKIAPVRCHEGREGYYAIPCYIIACESEFNWWARNPSGAAYIYQLLGWGAPPPTSFRNRVRNHEIAAGLSLSNWVCA